MHQTRRERRLLRADSDRPAPPQTHTSAVEFSVAALFESAHEDLPDMRPNILTVCTGNICRSPLAETVLAGMLADLDLRVHSAGTQALVGRGMPDPARGLAERNGVHPARTAAHRARLLTETLMRDADLVLTMTSTHSTAAVQLAPRRLHRTFTIREFARLAASLDDDALRRIAGIQSSQGNQNSARARFDAVVQAVSAQRGVAPRAAGNENVIDPYRQSDEVYERSAAQLIPALTQVERVTRIALQG